MLVTTTAEITTTPAPIGLEVPPGSMVRIDGAIVGEDGTIIRPPDLS